MRDCGVGAMPHRRSPIAGATFSAALGTRSPPTCVRRLSERLPLPGGAVLDVRARAKAAPDHSEAALTSLPIGLARVVQDHCGDQAARDGGEQKVAAVVANPMLATRRCAQADDRCDNPLLNSGLRNSRGAGHAAKADSRRRCRRGRSGLGGGP